MKILNLDKLAPTSTRFLTIGGVRHQINAMTLQNFLDVTTSAKALLENESTPADHFNNVVDTILMLAPTVPRSELVNKELDHLNTIAEFVRGGDVEEQEVIEQLEASAAEAGN